MVIPLLVITVKINKTERERKRELLEFIGLDIRVSRVGLERIESVQPLSFTTPSGLWEFKPYTDHCVAGASSKFSPG